MRAGQTVTVQFQINQIQGGIFTNTKDFAKKFIKAQEQAWQTGNCDALEKLEDPDIVGHTPQLQDTVGWEVHKQFIMVNRQAVSNLQQEWKYLTGEGNLFALSYKASGISSGKIPGLPPAGKEIKSDYLFLYRLKNGKVVETWSNGSFATK